MTRVIQIVVLVLTLVMSVIAGTSLENGYRMMEDYVSDHLGGRPVPAAVDFAMENRRAAPFLCLLPWVTFLGAALLGGPRDRPGSGDFVTGFILWVTLELFVAGFLTIVWALPLVSINTCMCEDSELGWSGFEIASATACGLAVLTIVGLAIRRRWVPLQTS